MSERPRPDNERNQSRRHIMNDKLNAQDPLHPRRHRPQEHPGRSGLLHGPSGRRRSWPGHHRSPAPEAHASSFLPDERLRGAARPFSLCGKLPPMLQALWWLTALAARPRAPPPLPSPPHELRSLRAARGSRAGKRGDLPLLRPGRRGPPADGPREGRAPRAAAAAPRKPLARVLPHLPESRPAGDMTRIAADFAARGDARERSSRGSASTGCCSTPGRSTRPAAQVERALRPRGRPAIRS